MKKAQMRNKISQILYRPKKEALDDDKNSAGLESLDNEIDKILNEIFGKKRKK